MYSVKFISLEFREEICAIDINLGVAGMLAEFRTGDWVRSTDM